MPRLLPLLLVFLLASCAAERRFEVQGRVVGFGDDSRTVIVAHEDVPGFMPAMTMPFKTRELPHEIGYGDAVGFTLVVTKKDSWIEDLALLPDTAVAPLQVEKKPQDAILDAGDVLPPAALVDEEGKLFDLADYRGKTLVVDFIYTRCPLPDFCPLLSNRFAELHGRLAGDTTVALLSVTLDPAFDTPEVLKAYRDRYTRTPNGWRMGTGTPEQVKYVWSLLGQFVLDDGQTIQHNLVAVVIGPDGRVQRYFRGQDWTVDALEEVVRMAQRTPTS